MVTAEGSAATPAGKPTHILDLFYPYSSLPTLSQADRKSESGVAEHGSAETSLALSLEQAQSDEDGPLPSDGKHLLPPPHSCCLGLTHKFSRHTTCNNPSAWFGQASDYGMTDTSEALCLLLLTRMSY